MNSSARLFRSTIVWSVLAALLCGLRYFASPASIERYYSRDLFLRIREIQDTLFGWWPIPASLVILIFLLGLLGFQLVRRAKQHWTHSSLLQKLREGAAIVFRWVAIVIFAFMLLWGFNYGRQPLTAQLRLTPKPLTTAELWTELEQTAKHLSILRTQLPLQNESDYESLPLFLSSQTRIREAVKKQLLELGYPNTGLVRIREVFPGGLLRWKTSGVYFPLSGEGHVDEGLHSLQKPFVMAHEMLHGFGITDEGSCNFLAWLACTRADNLYIRYSGHLTYYRYLGSALRRRDPEGYAAFRQNLPPSIQADLDSINENLDRFREFIPQVRDVVYDNYLKSQGISDGMASYSRFIDLVLAWRSGPVKYPERSSAVGLLPPLD